MKFQSYKPIFSVMEMFRPMFFVMVVALLLFWEDIFAITRQLNVWHFRVFVVAWIMMFLVTELVFTCYGDKALAFFKCNKKVDAANESEENDLEKNEATENVL